MKRGKKIGVTVLVLLFIAASGFCFWRGWIQFSVPTDACGIMVSKTGGVFQTPIQKGHFFWRWEPLLPTNTKLFVFSMRSEHFHKSIQGALPSADLYSLQIQQEPDFSYSFAYDISLQLKPDELITLVSSQKIQDTSDITTYLEHTADRIAALTTQFLLNESALHNTALLTAYSTEQILAGIKNLGDIQGISIRDITVSKAHIPDITLYNTAKNTFDHFQRLVDTELAALAKKQADSIVSDNRAINKLTKIGETLKKYPELSEVLKNGDTVSVLKALDTLR